VRVHVRDWPGFEGPLLHLPDPLVPSPLVEQLAALVTPRWRVMSIAPRPDVPYQVQLADVLGVMDQFGFLHAIVVAEGVACVTALLLATWYSQHVGRVVLVQPRFALDGKSLQARALRDCPPDCVRLRADLKCPVEEATSAEQVAATLP
jgi:pimeloyl-ACP methyl ester carboxylesterase